LLCDTGVRTSNERRICAVDGRDEAATMRNLINFESQTTTDCFLSESRDGARGGDGKRRRPASPINTPLVSRASPLYKWLIARHDGYDGVSCVLTSYDLLHDCNS